MMLIYFKVDRFSCFSPIMARLQVGSPKSAAAAVFEQKSLVSFWTAVEAVQ